MYAMALLHARRCAVLHDGPFILNGIFKRVARCRGGVLRRRCLMGHERWESSCGQRVTRRNARCYGCSTCG